MIGEKTDWRLALLLTGLTAIVVALVLGASRYADDVDVSHLAEPPAAAATMSDLDKAEARIDMLQISVATLEADLARSGAILIGEIERLKLALEASEERLAAPQAQIKPVTARPRKRSVPDPPASAYITLR